MSKTKEPDGCATLMRRSFLFILGIAAARFLHQYFSVSQNRSNFITFLGYLKEKAVEAYQENVGEKPLPNAPISQTSPTQKPLPNAPVPKASPTQKPGKPSPSPKFTASTKKGKPVEVKQNTINGVSFYQTTIDLNDPETFLTIGLANDAKAANTAALSTGDEAFEKFVSRHKAAVIVNGTFFSKDAQKRVMGNMVAGGKFVKYSRWENFGTTLGIKANNEPEMITARAEGKPEWNQHWFSLTCGPRLLKQGKVWLSPKLEGFTDPHVLDMGYRTAVGFSESRQTLFLISFLASLSLKQEAEIMKAIGCSEAMNLDGGASEALAYNGEILLPAGRNLTNVIVVYDTNNPAPKALKEDWLRFQNGWRPTIPT
ncbi:phosphodiester glycosidase family protein [Microcoleus sp. FACHB-672]|uniref:phosphodiester glycosidase family protein n=1 Tax=Microcoleus sp. FACHB-672 TaxID=2692825 RepID=UPI0016838426|nr:phosphodiester glycosidase family protein [Microcoleus sp. FACHB-672]MBD2039848.1 phosphodiester glycosidase family protein [Microcoleus sp. FACHB-672]